MPSSKKALAYMAAEDSELERTEPASQRRLDDARAEGNIARSPELSAFAVTMSALGVLWASGDALVDALKRMVTAGLTLDHAIVREPGAMQERLFAFAYDAFKVGGPILAATVIAGVVAPLAVGGWSFVPSAAAPKFSRLNPMSGLGRMFSTHGLTELGKALLKAGFIGGVGALVLWNAKDAMLGLAGERFDSALGHLGHMVAVSTLSIAAVLALIAAADVPLQLWRYAKKLRMSKEDVKREHKESEGDPHIKAAIRAQQREAAKKRMMADVP